MRTRGAAARLGGCSDCEGIWGCGDCEGTRRRRLVVVVVAASSSLPPQSVNPPPAASTSRRRRARVFVAPCPGEPGEPCAGLPSSPRRPVGEPTTGCEHVASSSSRRRRRVVVAASSSLPPQSVNPPPTANTCVVVVHACSSPPPPVNPVSPQVHRFTCAGLPSSPRRPVGEPTTGCEHVASSSRRRLLAVLYTAILTHPLGSGVRGP